VLKRARDASGQVVEFHGPAAVILKSGDPR
jgi:hypothetical protein